MVKAGRMKIQARHLIVGAGLLGLSVADHLLRRGARGVVLLEAERSPIQVRGPGLLLATGLEPYQALEERAFLLLEEWQTYLEVDPHYHRTGSLRFPHDSSPETYVDRKLERLDAGAVARRYPGLCLPKGGQAGFFPRDGRIDLIALLAALRAQVRKRSGQIYFSSELYTLTEEGTGFRFLAGSRSGHAEQVYITAGIGTIPVLRNLGVTGPFQLETWHRFHLKGASGGMTLLRLENDAAVYVDDGKDSLALFLAGPPDLHHRGPVVDWGLLQEFRTQQQQLLPGLHQARVQRGSAQNILQLQADSSAPFKVAEGRLLAAGAFGIYGILLALATGERLAEEGLVL